MAQKVRSASDIELKSDVFHSTGLSFHETGQFFKALEWYQEALELRRLCGNKKGQSITLNNIGLVYHDIGRFQDSISFYMKAIALKDELKEYKSLTATYANLGVAYEKLSEYKKAMEIYYKSLKISEELGDNLRTALTYQNMGIVHYQQNNNRYALELYKQARQLLAGGEDKVQLIQLDNNIGLVLKKLELYKEALPYFEQCLIASSEINYRDGIFAATNNMGAIFMLTGKFSEALSAYQKCYLLGAENNMHNEQCAAALNVGEIYTTLKRYKDAEDYLTQALTLSKKIEARDKEVDIYLILSRLHEEMDNPVEALKYYKEYDRLKSVITNAQSGNEINQLQTQYEVAKKEKEIEHARLLQVESELKALRAQMDPHFIFNALGSMRKELLEGNIDKADRYIVRFSRLLRLILDTTRTPQVRLSDNIELLHLYIQIEQSRQAKSFTYRIHLGKGIRPDEIQVSGMVLQPLVENAIVHGLFHRQDGKGRLYIGFSKTAGILKIKVSDNGVGRKQSQTTKASGHQSHATSIIQETLELAWKGKMKDKFFTIKDKVNAKGEPMGTEVVILLPLQ